MEKRGGLLQAEHEGHALGLAHNILPIFCSNRARRVPRAIVALGSLLAGLSRSMNVVSCGEEGSQGQNGCEGLGQQLARAYEVGKGFRLAGS